MARIIQDGSETMPINHVTRESRITGTPRRSLEPTPQSTYAPVLHWGPVLGSVLVGVAITAMLVILGVATGLIAANEGTSGDEAGGILGALGAWTVIAMLIGSFVGSFVGGRMTRWMDRLSIGGHTLISWGLATLLTIALASLVSIAFASTTTSVAATTTAAEVTSDANTPADAAAAAGGQAADGEQAADTAGESTAAETANETGDALGGAGWALAVGMLLALVASAFGWFLGARRKLTDIEREDSVPATA
ncbi:MAG: PhnA-like protein [Thermoleophilia bacterium]|nr:PhnA-like protein [Thermoleophilia bacterium]MCZ4496476.1 PhnA-like protein [Thermoleophilia bacterium]